LDGMIGDAAENAGEPGLRVDIVELGRGDQGVHRRGALAAAAPQGNTTQRALASDHLGRDSSLSKLRPGPRAKAFVRMAQSAA
jgi:hypothetical protein